MKPLEPHPLAELLPPMSDDEKKALRLDLQACGQRDDIVLFEGKILDGRNRYELLSGLRIKPRFTAFKGTREEAEDFVYSRAMRRNMNDGQKAVAAYRFRHAFKRRGVDLSSDEAAQPFGVSGRYVRMAGKIAGDAPHLLAKISAGEMSLAAATHASRRAARAKELCRVKPLAPDDASCRLLYGKAEKRLAELPGRSVRVIVTDPPYNIGRPYLADETGDALKDQEFLDWCAAWVSECARVLTPDGSIFVMMNGLYAGRLEAVLRAAGLHRRNTLYWWENNPEHQQGNFSDAVRQILYFTRSRTDFIFNADVRVPSRRNELGDKRGIEAGKLPDNVWIDNRIPGNSGDRVPFKDAPPQLPRSIPQTCILVASEAGDTVLDPFNGNGTTGIAALANGRKYIGIDRSKVYLDQSRKWIARQLGELAERRK